MRWAGRSVWVAALTVTIGCGGGDTAHPGDFPVDGEGGKTDVFGRALVGRAQPYPADETLGAIEERLRSDVALRRQVAWEIVARALQPVPLLGLAERAEASEDLVLPDGEVPRVPRFQTWYGVDDFKRMFQYLYEGKDRAERLRREPFTEAELDEAEDYNASAIDRSRRWPLERFLRYVEQLGVCEEGTPEDECARRLQSNFSGAAAGNVRITYSPATVRHLLANYGNILDCMERLSDLPLDATPTDEENFTFCYAQEMPVDAVLIKAQWIRSDLERDMPVYDTDADTLRDLLGPTNTGTWPEEGHRRADPADDEIVTIRLRNGSTYRLAGLHVMTKELRHWTWITLFWSDRPNLDFGEDRPQAIRDLDPVWSHYKMCVVVDYEEDADDPGAGLEELYPSLAAALRATPTESASWCSNPYVEEGRGNARTNCIGCHQHGASAVGADLDGDGAPDPLDLEQIIDDERFYPSNGRTRQRDVFPSDYLWSATRVDNLFQVIRSEVDRADVTDSREIEERAARILAATGEPSRGAALFATNCARCHGADGTGDFGPNLYDRVPMRDDDTLARRLLLGLGPMPAWDSVLSDQELADLLAFLRATFDAPPSPSEVTAAASGLPTDIPDNDATGVEVSIEVATDFPLASVRVQAAISHPFRGDLVVELIHDTIVATLHDRTGGSLDDLDIDATPAAFAGASSAGTWTLRVRDEGVGDRGTLDSFRLTLSP